jgi:hypothetical protein
MFSKPPNLEQASDEQLDKGLQRTVENSRRLQRNSRHAAPVAAGAIILGAVGLYHLGAWAVAATGSAFVAPLMVIASCGILFSGIIGYAVGWARICDSLHLRWHKRAENIVQEQKVRAYKKTPAYREVLRRAAEAAAEEALRVKERLKKAFNEAVEKTFHGGTTRDIKVSGPLKFKTKFKKPGDPPAPKPGRMRSLLKRLGREPV